MQMIGQEVIFNVFKALEYPDEHEDCLSLDVEKDQKMDVELEDDEKRKEDDANA